MKLEIDIEQAEVLGQSLRRDAERLREAAYHEDDTALAYGPMSSRSGRRVAQQHRLYAQEYLRRATASDAMADSILGQVENERRLRRLRREAGWPEELASPPCGTCDALGVVAGKLCPTCGGVGSGVAGL